MAKTSTKPTSKASGADLLRSIGSKGTGKAKSATPQVILTERDQLEAVAAILNAKRVEAEAESARKLAEGTFCETATDLFEKRCLLDGKCYTSVRMMGTLDGEALALQYIQTRRCKKMQEADAGDVLRSAFAEDFDRLFAPQRTVEIDTSMLTDRQIELMIEGLQKALGDQFDSAVTVEAVIQPKEVFFSERILNRDIRLKADHAAADGFAVPFAPSFKA